MNNTGRTECSDCGEVLYGGDLCLDCKTARRAQAALELEAEDAE